MSFKSVLAVVGAINAAPDIGKAINVAAGLEAHLTIMVLGVALPPLTADYPLSTAWLDERQREIDVLVEVAKQAEELCRRNGVSCEVDHYYDDRFILESNISTRAMYADLVLAGPGVRSSSDLRKAVVAAVAFDTRTPLLLMPTGEGAALKPKNVLVAWNSRPEAANACKAGLELLQDADAVHVALVDPDAGFFRNGGEPGADVAEFLARHGVKVEVEQIASAGRRIEDVLRQHALELGCDLILMGAYGHSRLRERIFGGVTASILEEARIPVFMAR